VNVGVKLWIADIVPAEFISVRLCDGRVYGNFELIGTGGIEGLIRFFREIDPAVSTGFWRVDNIIVLAGNENEREEKEIQK
jgi:hypothetical protein